MVVDSCANIPSVTQFFNTIKVAQKSGASVKWDGVVAMTIAKLWWIIML